MAANVIDSPAEIDGVSQDDGIDDEVEAGRPVGHERDNPVALSRADG